MWAGIPLAGQGPCNTLAAAVGVFRVRTAARSGQRLQPRGHQPLQDKVDDVHGRHPRPAGLLHLHFLATAEGFTRALFVSNCLCQNQNCHCPMIPHSSTQPTPSWAPLMGTGTAAGLRTRRVTSSRLTGLWTALQGGETCDNPPPPLRPGSLPLHFLHSASLPPPHACTCLLARLDQQGGALARRAQEEHYLIGAHFDSLCLFNPTFHYSLSLPFLSPLPSPPITTPVSHPIPVFLLRLLSPCFQSLSFALNIHQAAAQSHTQGPPLQHRHKHSLLLAR
jgi:hypothetical protein